MILRFVIGHLNSRRLRRVKSSLQPQNARGKDLAGISDLREDSLRVIRVLPLLLLSERCK